MTPVPPGDGFGLDHLPYGAFVLPGGGPARLGVRLHDRVLDLRAAVESGSFPGLGESARALCAPVLNPLLELGAPAWREVRAAVTDLLTDGRADLLPLDAVELTLAFEVADYVDFYSSEDHAANLSELFRGSRDLPRAWRALPIGYHGRAGSVVVSGTPVVRPAGHYDDAAGALVLAPTASLDIELEIGFVTGGPATTPGQTLDFAAAAERMFGVVLVNDWSARDLQRFEYVPLGPFLGKSFATSVSGWVTPMAALASARVPAPRQEPRPAEHLRDPDAWTLDLALSVAVQPAGRPAERVLSRPNARTLYWTFAQQLVHAASNGAVVRPGDLYASGTISGPGPDTVGSLIELTANGRRPLEIDGDVRCFLHDGDRVVLRGGTPDGRITLGEVEGTIRAAPGAAPRQHRS